MTDQELADRQRLVDALRLAYTALERSTPRVGDADWVGGFVLPTIKEALT